MVTGTLVAHSSTFVPPSPHGFLCYSILRRQELAVPVVKSHSSALNPWWSPGSRLHLEQVLQISLGSCRYLPGQGQDTKRHEWSQAVSAAHINKRAQEGAGGTYLSWSDPDLFLFRLLFIAHLVVCCTGADVPPCSYKAIPLLTPCSRCFHVFSFLPSTQLLHLSGQLTTLLSVLYRELCDTHATDALCFLASFLLAHRNIYCPSPFPLCTGTVAVWKKY